jgi:hypothetical protein
VLALIHIDVLDKKNPSEHHTTQNQELFALVLVETSGMSLNKKTCGDLHEASFCCLISEMLSHKIHVLLQTV